MGWLIRLAAALFGGAVAAWLLTTFIAAATFGGLWLWVYGDDPWPAWVGKVAEPAIILLALLIWLIAARRIWRTLGGNR